jgi:RNA polymerase sigma-70 factor (ECF subfamily)
VAKLFDIRIGQDLLAQACCGDEHAQSQIYAALAPATIGLIRRVVGGGAQAEDLFQDTMMTFFERLHTYRAEAPIGAWLRQIALSKCFMYLRSPWYRARLQLSGASEEEGAWKGELSRASVPGPVAESMDVERALSSLSPTARAVVWLFEVEGYSHEEIGRCFGRSTSFSKSQLARAHSRLRDWFEPSVERPACTSI